MGLITGKHMPRRTFLRGLGASVALPFLDAMIPAGTSAKAATNAAVGRTPLVCIEEVHGLAGCNAWGASQNLFAPATTGPDFELSPENALSPLAPFQDYLTIISNTDVRNAEALSPPEIGGDHFRSSAVFLTQSHPKQTQGSDHSLRHVDGPALRAAIRPGHSDAVDAVLCIEKLDQAGGCLYNYACAYTDSISWASPTEPLPMIRDPRVAFDLIFGAGGTAEERAARRRANRSVLDWIVDEVAFLKRTLSANDQARLDRYLEDVRELERRIAGVEARNLSGEVRELPEAPAGVPDSFEEHMKLMFDLQALAFASDMTRVFSFKTGRDASGRVYPESGVDKPFHPASHHGGNEEAILDFFRINQYHVSMLPYFLDKLADLQEGDASLLDKTMIVFGSPMADGNLHNHRRCPLLLLGGANGQLDGGQHIVAPDGEPMANVMLSLLHGLGLEDVESFGDSTRPFSLRV